MKLAFVKHNFLQRRVNQRLNEPPAIIIIIIIICFFFEKILLTTKLTVKILFTINSLEKKKIYSFKTLFTIPVD